MRAKELLDRLEKHYIKPGEIRPGGVFVPEVTLGGAGGPRADAIFIGFTSTTGKGLVGHELKVSRSDWLAELAKPEKAEAWASQCHSWYLVVPTADIVRDGELPPEWGLMVPTNNRRFKVLHKAAWHMTRQPSWKASRAVVTRLDSLRVQRLADEAAKVREQAWAEISKRVDQQVEQRMSRVPDVSRLQSKLQALERALGVTVTESGSIHYRGREVSAQDLAKAGRLAIAHRDLDSAVQRLVGQHAMPLANVKRSVADIEAALADFKRA